MASFSPNFTAKSGLMINEKLQRNYYDGRYWTLMITLSLLDKKRSDNLPFILDNLLVGRRHSPYCARILDL